MLRDIISIDGSDLGIAQSDAPRAANILATQFATLEYAPTFGVDLKYFLESEFRIQNQAFKAYLVQRLLEHQCNVVQVTETIERISRDYEFSVGEPETTGGLVT